MLLHAPQLFTVFCATQVPPQQSWPAAHAAHDPQCSVVSSGTQLPAQHACAPGHARPHTPQFMFEASETHAPPQQPSPAAQRRPHVPQLVTVSFAMHEPPQHASPAPHTRPHIPQLFRSVRVSDSHPFVESPSQLKKFITQGLVQSPPAAHVGIVFGRAMQAFPQRPQFATVSSAASQPSAAFRLQSPCVATQTNPQTAARHVAEAFAGRGHARPQPPQLGTLADVFVSQPSAGIMLQLPYGATQLIPHTPPVHLAFAFAGTGHDVGQLPQ